MTPRSDEAIAHMSRSRRKAQRKPSPLKPNLAEIAREVAACVEGGTGERRQRTLAIFDMEGSTAQKVREGQRRAITAAMTHNLLCRRLTGEYGGRVLKELGDGLLCLFDDPVAACITGLNIKAGVRHLPDVDTKGAITTGVIQELVVGGVTDALGEPVDRCARILSYALPGQVLIDQATRDSARAWLADYEGVALGDPADVELRGLGPARLFELSPVGQVVGDLKIPFRIEPTGRFAVEEKDRFLRTANELVVELGTGLTTFADYLEGSRPAERKFAEHVVDALKRGVTIACYALDPESEIARQYLADRGEPAYLEGIHGALRKLTKWKEVVASGLPGSFEVHVYSHFPYLHAMCIDPDSDRARMIVSHYLYETRRADTPYVQLSREENPLLFEKWSHSVEMLIADAPEWEEQR